MGTYGRSFTLSNLSNYGMNAPTTGGGTAGEFTKESGFLAFYEVCQMMKEGATYFWVSLIENSKICEIKIFDFLNLKN